MEQISRDEFFMAEGVYECIYTISNFCMDDLIEELNYIYTGDIS